MNLPAPAAVPLLPRAILAAAIVATLAGAGCTAPDEFGENGIAIDDPGGALQGRETAIHAVLTATLEAVYPTLPITGVTITLRPDPAQAIAGYGAGGVTPDARTVHLFLDPSFPTLDEVIAQRLGPLLAHELHHAIRWRNPGYGATLFEAMISEGLADHFAVETLGVPAPPWSDGFGRDSTAYYLALARPEFDSRSYDHSAWFFDTSPTLPRWTGYTLGFRLVETYLAAHPGATAAQLVGTPAPSFRPE